MEKKEAELSFMTDWTERDKKIFLKWQSEYKDSEERNRKEILKDPTRPLSDVLERLANYLAEDDLRSAEIDIKEIWTDDPDDLPPDLRRKERLREGLTNGSKGVWNMAKPLSFFIKKMRFAEQRADALFELLEKGNITDLSLLPPNNALTLIAVAVRTEERARSKAETIQQLLRSQVARHAANEKHEKNGNRAKQEAIRLAWASGKFKSRDICAEQESAALGMSFSTARKALRRTPKPS